MLGTCFAYGVFHAVGPGHGKLLIGGYGLGREVPILRLSAISILSVLGQAATAILLAGAGLLALDWARQRLIDTAETVMLPLSTLAIGLIGVWLTIRGVRRLVGVVWRAEAGARMPQRGSDRRPDWEGACGCRHRHGPAPGDMASANGMRESIALVAAIAIRPCSGALLLLVLTWHMGIPLAGMLGTVAMSLGTATLTVAVGILSVLARRSALLSLGMGNRARLVLPAIEVAAGVFIATAAIGITESMP